jgi:hypothetical protein
MPVGAIQKRTLHSYFSTKMVPSMPVFGGIIIRHCLEWIKKVSYHTPSETFTILSRVLVTEEFGLVIGFIDHLKLVTTIVTLFLIFTLQAFHPNLLSLSPLVFTICFLATDLNIEIPRQSSESIPTCLHYLFPGNGSQHRNYHRLTLQIPLHQVSHNYN